MKKRNRLCSLKEQVKSKRRRKWYYTVSVTLAAIVVFCTVYALILPAITMEKTQKVLDCPLSVHQHTAECLDENGTPCCGQADFVIHTHNEGCYNAENELVCKLPERTAHEHTDGCYESQQVLICTDEAEEHIHGESCYQTEKTLVCKETAVLHTHDNTCKDENGSLICGKLEVTEHVHGAACLHTKENEQTLLLENGVMPAADTANKSWGYNPNGSIWWNEIALANTAYDAVAAGTPYIIAGNSRLNLLTDTPQSDTMLTTVRPGIGNVSSYKSYAIWYFEESGDPTGGYRIYTQSGSETEKRYLKLNGTALSLTDESGATVFTAEQATLSEYEAQCITLKAGDGYYLNASGSDSYGCSGWAGWNEADQGSCLQLLSLTEEKQTANRVEDTASSPNIVFNLFDYWVSENQNDPDNVDALLDGGINQGHALKFVHGDQDGTTAVNQWTGGGQNPRQGIVQNRLGANGYPVLSDSVTLEGCPAEESLEYLFNPEYAHIGKESYRNVGGLFAIDAQGYYSFNCKTHMAEFNKERNSFYIYDRPAGSRFFFPLNKAPEIMLATKSDPSLNHYFGATISARFVQQNNGYTDDRHTTPTSFYFSGDDDVWIFIDGVLVGDVGGIHDAASVDINFATGEVEVCVVGGSSPLKTTLYECYQNAGKTDASLWTDDNKTYRDGTVHTLKFFFLERGNYDSNMQLKYNLTAIPQTAIYKVDQYGAAVPDATFAVYAADADYQLLDKVNGSPVVLPDSYSYDGSGNIIDGSGNVLANALYLHTTDQNGKLLFADSDDMPYSINELQDMFGQKFILREINVPNGFRTVSRDIHLQIWQGGNQKIIKCDNTRQSGARAASSIQITATDKLYLHTPHEGQSSVDFYNPDTGETFGTLFAVVFRYVGAVDGDGNATEMADTTKWLPVYGNDRDGYQMLDMTDKTLLAGALETAVEAQKYGNVIFRPSFNSSMQLTLENLPGHITTYYGMLGDGQKSQTRYTLGYYWTPAETLEAATADSVHQVYSFAGTVPDAPSYSGFERMFGANIQVSNLINKVFVQKMDENNNRINGATFAIYQVQQAADGTIRYRSEDGSYLPLSEDAVIASDGKITDGSTVFNPLDVDVTKTYADNVHIGTAEFDYLPAGQYILKEVKAPPGYKLNPTDVMVLVTEDTIYANAGTEDDGVTVGRGPGYLVTPLNEFASEGQIENTLSWIYAQMRISKESNRFADVGNPSMLLGYLKENNSAVVTADPAEAFKTYLEYAKDMEGTAFNYVPNSKRHTGETDSDGYRRLFTTVGWPYYEIYQDYSYGLEKARENGAHYEDWSDVQLENLFSRSTYIRVTDKQETTLSVQMADAASPDVGLAGAQFRLYKIAADGTAAKLYYRFDAATQTVQWTEEEAQALVITTGEDGTADLSFTGLKDGEYYLEEMASPDGYYKQKEPVLLRLENAKLTVASEAPSGEQGAKLTGSVLNSDNLYVYTVTVYNATGFELPATGGSGTTLYTIGGILLMALPLVYGYRKRRAERRLN